MFLGDDSNVNVDRLNELARGMALGATNNRRFSKEIGAEIAEGYASIALVIVVRWRWLSLQESQVLITAVFLIYVVVDTALPGVGIVKSSNMAELMVSKKGDVRAVNGPESLDLVASGIASKVYGILTGAWSEKVRAGIWIFSVVCLRVLNGHNMDINTQAII